MGQQSSYLTMADQELEELRAKRLAEMQARAGVGGPGKMQGDPGSQAQAQEDKMRQVEDMKNSILNQVLTQEARARLNTLRIAKPEKGQKIEAMLIQMAQTGQLGGKIGEDDLIGLLEKISGTTSQPKVKFDRRRAALDSDSE